MAISKNFGTLLYYLLWPAVWIYAPMRVRVRVLVRVGDELLVVKNLFGPNSWQLPGGGKKLKEDVKSAAIREVYEEFNLVLEPSKAQLLTNSPFSVKSNGILFRYHYVMFVLPSKLTIEPSKEISDAKWMKLNDVDIPKTVLAKLSTIG